MTKDSILACGRYIEKRTNEYLNDMEEFCQTHEKELSVIEFAMVIGISTIADGKYKDGLTLGRIMGDSHKFPRLIRQLKRRLKHD